MAGERPFSRVLPFDNEGGTGAPVAGRSLLGAPLQRFKDWMALHDPGPFDGPTRQEVTLLLGGILLAPLFIPLLILVVPFTDEFSGDPLLKRLKTILLAPFLLPVAYGYIIAHDVVMPIFRRRRERLRILKHASKQVAFLEEWIQQDPPPF